MRTLKSRARAKASRHRSSSRKESPNSGTGAAKPSAECASSSRKQTRTSSRSGSGWALIWSHDGIICTGESYKNVVKLTFAKGASLKDPARLFNSSLDGNARRAIDIHEGEEVDESAFDALVRQAVALNSSGKSKPSKKVKS